MPQPPLSPSLVPNWSQFPKQTLLTPQFTTPILIVDANWVAPGVSGGAASTRLVYPFSSNSSAQYQYGSDIAPLSTTAPYNYSVVWYSITASRTAYLPPARFVGQMITLCDMSGSLTQSITITITPNGTDTIDGAASSSLTMAKGSRTLLCVAFGLWITINAQGQKMALTYTGSSTHTPGPNIRFLTVTLAGGGGGGGGSDGVTYGGAGGGGGLVFTQTVAVTPGTGYTVTIGGGGSAGSSGGAGGNGGTTSFGALLSAAGGGGGVGSSTSGNSPGLYGISGTAPISANVSGSAYGCGAAVGGSNPGGSAWGAGGASGGNNVAFGGGGGGSLGTGGAGANAGSGAAAGTYGGGGGGASTTFTTGQVGGDGAIIVEWVVN